MTWKQLSELLYNDRERLFGSFPEGRSLSSMLRYSREDITAEEIDSREGVDAAARLFARNREELPNLSIEENHFLQARFDWAVALTSLLWITAKFNDICVIQEPTASEEDLIEWALIATWHYESWALDQTVIDAIQRRQSAQSDDQ
jgi:hypothetical protein